MVVLIKGLFALFRSMIEHLRSKFGSVRVTNDPDGRTTFAEVLDGWRNDDEVTTGLELRDKRAAAQFESWLDQINDFASFQSEDDFANYLQTSTRPGSLPVGEEMLMTDGNPAKRAFTQDRRLGAGVHNWLHVTFMEGRASPIDVGNAALNLGNIMFWRIHGWIEAKWKDFEAGHQRTKLEQTTYNALMTRFRTVLASRNGASAPPPHVPTPVSQNVRPVLLSNTVDCSRLTPHTVTDDCPKGRTDVQTTPHVNNGTACVLDTNDIKLAQTTLIQRGHLAPFVNGHAGNDGVWGSTSQAALNRWLQANRLPAAECLTRSILDMLKALFRAPPAAPSSAAPPRSAATPATRAATRAPTTRTSATRTPAPSRWWW